MKYGIDQISFWRWLVCQRLRYNDTSISHIDRSFSVFAMLDAHVCLYNGWNMWYKAHRLYT